jgi:hypothetical protein
MDINSSIRMTDLRNEMPLLRQEETRLRSILSSSDSPAEAKEQAQVDLEGLLVRIKAASDEFARLAVRTAGTL